MWRGLYTAGAGMIQETQRTDTIANNLANVNTTGYKRDVAVSSEFEPMLIRRINDKDMRSDVTSFKGFSLGGNPPVVGTLGLGSEIAEIATDHSQGNFESTGNPYDVAISGEGYFEIQTPQGVRYTRDGAFFRSRTGVLENVRGQAVLSEKRRLLQIFPVKRCFHTIPPTSLFRFSRACARAAHKLSGTAPLLAPKTIALSTFSKRAVSSHADGAALAKAPIYLLILSQVSSSFATIRACSASVSVTFAR